ncbi:MAG TPA: phosphatidylglycerol lysyltransferase domain-containing protein [Actinomycetota bacterium]|nr:phosphatidylglycerol lysyltransferase domain-containing protein [Actinomycetota bacterium]
MGATVVDLLELPVPAGGRVLVANDLHLGGHGSHQPVEDLTAAIERASGPGVLVLNGDIIELALGTPPDIRAVLQHEGRLTAAVRSFAAGPGRRVVYLLGNHDSRLAWDGGAAGAVAEAFGCDLALALELEIETGSGTRKVRVEHGHRLDPPNAFTDPRDPLDIPFGLHVTRHLGPVVTHYEIFDDSVNLADGLAFPRYVASRLTFRRFARHLKWLALPFLVALLLKLPLTLTLLSKTEIGARIARWPNPFLFIGGLVVADLVLVVAAMALAAYAVWEATSNVAILSARRGRNDAARADALARVREGYAGMITGHTHLAELAPLGDGFYANAGCCAEAVEESRSRLGPLPVFRSVRQTSWVELEAGSDLHVRLVSGRQPLPAGSALERLAVRPERASPRPVVVASLPGGPSWPPPTERVGHQRVVRARAATAIALVGLLNLASAAVPPLFVRLHWLRTIVPLAVPEAAAALVALAGLGLLFLSGGVRRGGRRAWGTALVLLGGSAVLHLAKGVEVAAAILALAVAAYLGSQRAAFRGGAAPGGFRVAFRTAVAGSISVIVAATVAVEVVMKPRLPLGRAVAAVTGRLVGAQSVALPDRLNDFLSPVMLAVAGGLVALAAWTIFRPVHAARRRPGSGLARARELVERYGDESFSYFALRSDKELFFSGDTVVPYSVVGRVCVVSPDPVGPSWEREQAWEEFHRYADARGWPVTVLGASDDWLPIYHCAGMRELYAGDEAIVDCHRFDLDHARWEDLRRRVAGPAAAGYHVEFLSPAHLDPFVESELRGLATESHRPTSERRFSMTLGRLFDPQDDDIVLAVAVGPDGHPAALAQFVPAPAIGGYTLDQVRRTTRAVPEELTDLLMVHTIRHLGDIGVRTLSLNFSVTRRTIIRREADGLGGRAQRWLLEQLSRAMPVEHPWEPDEAYEPAWRPRYFVYDGRGHFPAAAMAVVRSVAKGPSPVVGPTPVPVGPRPADGLFEVSEERGGWTPGAGG